MRKLKVYSGLLHTVHGQRKHIMASTSWAKVAAATNCSIGYLRDYWNVTGNQADIETALKSPETLINTHRSL